MPALHVPDAALINLAWFHAPARTWINVIGARAAPTTTINQALANTLSTAIMSAFTTNFAVHVGSTALLSYVAIRDIRQPNLPRFIGTAASVPGTATGDMLPGTTSLVMSLRTAKAGQSFRGRVYLGGFTEAANDASGSALAAVGTAGVAFINAISTAFSANGLTLAVVSRPSERVEVVTTTFHSDGSQDVETKVSPARAGQVTDVTSIAARNSLWDSQRRRAAPGSSSTLFRDVASQEIGGELVSSEELQSTRRSR